VGPVGWAIAVHRTHSIWDFGLDEGKVLTNMGQGGRKRARFLKLGQLSAKEKEIGIWNALRRE